MKHFKILLASTSLVALTSAAFAEPATNEGAERLTASFQSYFSDTPGVVSVKPEGETYTLTLDFAPFAVLAAEEGAEVSVSPLNYTLTDLGDGTWNVTEDQSFSMKISAPGVMDYSLNAESMVSEGVWDEALKSYASYSFTATNFNVSSSFQGPDGMSQDSNQSYAKMTTEMSASAASGGGVDSNISMVSEGMNQTMTMPLDPMGAPINLVATADTQTVNYKISALQTEPVFGLLSWFVAHPSEEAITANQEELRGLLKTGIPFFENIDATGNMANLKVQSPVGEFSADNIAFTVNTNGVVAEGKLREAVTISGLSIPAGLAPDWAAPLVPETVSLDFELTDFDLVNPINTLIDTFDLTKDEPVPDETFMLLMGGFMPEGLVNIGLTDLAFSNDTYSIKAQGQMGVGPFGPPAGEAVVTAAGLDKVQEALSSAPPEVGMQVLGPLGMATSLAKPGDAGELIWEIDATQPGKLSVNGNSIF